MYRVVFLTEECQLEVYTHLFINKIINLSFESLLRIDLILR